MIKLLTQSDAHAVEYPLESLEQKIGNREAVVGVVGLGYVGLPLVRAFVNAGYKALGFDVDQRKICLLYTSRCV